MRGEEREGKGRRVGVGGDGRRLGKGVVRSMYWIRGYTWISPGSFPSMWMLVARERRLGIETGKDEL